MLSGENLSKHITCPVKLEELLTQLSFIKKKVVELVSVLNLSFISCFMKGHDADIFVIY